MVTCAVPAFLLLTGVSAENVTRAAIVLRVRRTTELHDDVVADQPVPDAPADRRG